MTNNEEKALQVLEESLTPDARWSEIVSAILREYNDELPDKALIAAELLMNGFTMREVSDKLSVTQQTIRQWLVRYPKLAVVVAHGRELLSRWRLGQLEQQFYDAVELSKAILSVTLSGEWTNPETGELEKVNSKTLGIQAQHARFLISLFTNQRIDVVVKLDEGTAELFKARQSALDYIADQITSMRDTDEPIEATYRLVDPKEESGPLLDSDGNPFHGTIGEMTVTESGVLCHVCGDSFPQLAIHIRTKHRLSIDNYEMTFMLTSGSVSLAVTEYENLKLESSDEDD